MDELIDRFLAVSNGYGNGSGYSNGSDYGSGNGSGNGSGHGYGNVDGYDGSGYGNGYGNGSGNGSGHGYGNGYGNGSGNGSGEGIQEIDGHRVYSVDDCPTIILSVHGNYAKGYTLLHNVNPQPCYIAKVGDYFAHGATLHAAKRDAQKKYDEAMPLADKIKLTITKYPSLDTIVPNADLFELHHLLTCSCQYGREQFCKEHSICLESSMTMREFIDVTRNAYGGDAIFLLYQKYINSTSNEYI